MQLSRALELLVLGLSAMSVAEATFIGINAHHDGRKGIQRRQDDDDAPADTPTTTPPTEPTETPADPTSSSDPPVITTETSEVSPPPTTSSTPDDPPPSTSLSPGPSSTSSSLDDPQPTDKPDPTPDAPEDTPQNTVVTYTEVITSIREDGSPTTITSETVSTSTLTPGLANGGGDTSSGMSTTTRNTVIGVVVGVGGAIVLGGLALVAWRIWGRKKHQEENDGLMDYGSTVDAKPESAAGSGPGAGSMASRSPFQSTLESYHAPTQVNTAANF